MYRTRVGVDFAYLVFPSLFRRFQLYLEPTLVP